MLAVDEKESPQALLPACPVDVYSDQQSLQIWLLRRASSPQSTPSSCKVTECGSRGADHPMFARRRPQSSGSAQFCGILSERLLAPTVDSAHQHLHPGPAADSVRAHVNEETTLPRVLAVDEKESPQALLPECPVDVYSDQQSLQIYFLRRASSPQSTPSSCMVRECGSGGANHPMFARRRPQSSVSAQFCRILNERLLAPVSDEKKA